MTCALTSVTQSLHEQLIQLLTPLNDATVKLLIGRFPKRVCKVILDSNIIPKLGLSDQRGLILLVKVLIDDKHRITSNDMQSYLTLTQVQDTDSKLIVFCPSKVRSVLSRLHPNRRNANQETFVNIATTLPEGYALVTAMSNAKRYMDLPNRQEFSIVTIGIRSRNQFLAKRLMQSED